MRLHNDMRLKLKKKISSRTGASITFALLIFLICTVVGSVVLTAGTAAAGRIAQVTRIDQKYYSVSSAAQLLEKELSGKEVVFVRNEVREKGKDPVYTTYINGVNRSDYDSIPELSFLTRQAACFLFKNFDKGGEGFHYNDEVAMNFTMYNGNPNSANFTLTHTGSGESGGIDFAKLKVSGKCAMRSDGTLLISLTDNVDEGNHYSLTMTLSPKIDEDESVSTSADGSKITTKKTSKIKWTVNGISKGDKL